MTIRRKLDVPMNILVTAPVKMALQKVADENMVSVSDIVRAAINAAVPMQYEQFPLYLEQATEQYLRTKDNPNKVLERTSE